MERAQETKILYAVRKALKYSQYHLPGRKQRLPVYDLLKVSAVEPVVLERPPEAHLGASSQVLLPIILRKLVRSVIWTGAATQATSSS